MRHKLLARQLRRHVDDLPAGLEAFVGAVDSAYRASDEDRQCMERALALTSEELVAVNDRLKAENAQLRVMEERMRRREDDLRRLVDASPAGVVIQCDGIICYANLTLARWLGYEVSELLGRESLELVAPEDRDDVLRRRSGQPTRPRLTRLRTKQGPEVLVDIDTPVAIEWSGRNCALLVGRNVSQERMIQERLELSDRLTSLGRMAAGIAHEINNPLAYVFANLSYLQEHLESSSSDLTEALADALDGAHRVRGIVQDLRVFGREHQQEHVAVDLSQVVRRAVALVGTQVGNGVSVILAEPEGCARVSGSDGRLTQVFVNLLVNANHAVRQTGSRAQDVRIEVRRNGDIVEADVTDCGPGIPPGVLGRVFDPFFTTKPVGEGNGLGLSICHAIVADHGGRIAIVDTGPAGTTIRVSLPAAQHDPTRLVAPRDAPAAPPPQKGLRILVIDDEPAVRAGLCRMLSGEHHVVQVPDGRSAMELLRDQRFDVILCDVSMPGTSGLEVYQAIEHDDRTAESFAFITGGALSADAATFLGETPCQVLYKPFTKEALHALVESIRAK